MADAVVTGNGLDVLEYAIQAVAGAVNQRRGVVEVILGNAVPLARSAGAAARVTASAAPATAVAESRIRIFPLVGKRRDNT